MKHVYKILAVVLILAIVMPYITIDSVTVNAETSTWGLYASYYQGKDFVSDTTEYFSVFTQAGAPYVYGNSVQPNGDETTIEWFDETINGLLSVSEQYGTIKENLTTFTEDYSIGKDGYMVHFAGTIMAEEPGTYSFVGLQVDNGCVIKIGGTTVYEYWGYGCWFDGEDHRLEGETSFSLQANTPTYIEIYYLELNGGESLEFQINDGEADKSFEEAGIIFDLSATTYLTWGFADLTEVLSQIIGAGGGNQSATFEGNDNYDESIDQIKEVLELVNEEPLLVDSFIINSSSEFRSNAKKAGCVGNNGILVEYTGYLTADRDGTYSFGLTNADNGCMVEINGQRVIEYWGDKGTFWNNGTPAEGIYMSNSSMELKAGESVPIRVVYLELNGEESFTMTVKAEDGEAVAFDASGFTLSPGMWENMNVNPVEYGGHYYQRFDKGMTWQEAKAYCEDLGGYLVTITSAAEQAFVESIVTQGSKYQYWIGLTTAEDPQWVTGESFFYSNWDSGDPDNQTREDGESEDYVHINNKTNPANSGSKRFKWNDMYYDNTFPGEENHFSTNKVGFICEWGDINTGGYNGNTYERFDESLTWNEAKAYCESLGGHLVTITSAEEQAFIETLLATGEKNQYWIGLTTAEDPQWITGEDFSYSNWDPGDPDNHTREDGESEDYVHINNIPNPANIGSKRFKWNDMYYDNIFPGEEEHFSTKNVGFICEWEGEIKTGLQVFSDYPNLSIRKDCIITIGVGIYINGQQINDISGITFSIEDPSIISTNNIITKDNLLYVKFKGTGVGTTYITFSDSYTGYVRKIPITIFKDNSYSFTLSSIPTQNIEKYETNFYNFNGLFVDNYQYDVNDDKTVNISFDVYNTNYIYGAVEVYDFYGNMKDAVLLDKMTNSATSIKGALLDNSGFLVRDIIDGDLLTYRQESGYSKKTSVSVKVPENGYIKITIDTDTSFVVSLVNSVDILMGVASLDKQIGEYNINSKNFSEKLTAKLVKEAIYAEFIKDGDAYAKQLVKNIGSEALLSAESLGDFSQTITNNIAQLNVEKLLVDTAKDFGWSISENLVTYFSGPIGKVLKGMFMGVEFSNIIVQKNDYVKAANNGSITIQNQGGGVRSVSQIKVESETDFTDDTALNVFKVIPDSQLLSTIKEMEPELYQNLCGGLTYTYDISMIKDGQESQLENNVSVYLPIPDDLKLYAYTGAVKIYRVEEDGSMTEMNTDIKDNCFVFETEHFSLYTILGFDEFEEDTYVTDILDYTYDFLDSGTIEINGYMGEHSKIELPNEIDGYIVTSIAEKCFESNVIISEVIVPDSIKYINSRAFFDCINLKKITIPKSIVNIEKDAFGGCVQLIDVNYIGAAIQWEEMGIESGNEELTSAEINFSILSPANELTFSGAALLLQSDLAIKYKVNIKDFENSGYKYPCVRFTMNNSELLVCDYTTTDDEIIFDFTNIAPYMINDTIYATLYATYNGVEYASVTKEYSVATYCYNMLGKYITEEYAELQTLLVDLLNYGSKTQEYLNYKTDALANAQLTEEQAAWGTNIERTLETVQNTQYETIENPSVLWKGAGLTLQDSIAMRFKIVADNIENLCVKVVNANGEWIIPSSAFELIEEGSYYVYFDTLSAAQMSEPIYLTVYNGDVAVSHTIRYSIESYAYAKQNDQDTKLVELVKAMIKYGDSAYAYVS